MLTREQILECNDLPSAVVKVPEWGGEVLVRGLTGAQRDWLEASMFTGKRGNREANMENFRAKIVCLSVSDENGNPIFTEKDVAALSKKSALALQRVFNVALKLSGLTQEEAEQLTKN